MLGSIAATHERPLEERVRPRLFNARNGVSMSAASHSSRTSPITEGSRARLPRGAAPAMDAAVWAISVAAVACLDVDDGRGGGGLAAGSTLVLAVGLHRVTRVILPADRSRLIAIDAIPRLLQRRVPLFEFVIRTCLADLDLDTAEGRVRGLRSAAPIIAGIRDRALRREYTRRLAGWLGMPDSEAVGAVRAAERRGASGPGSPGPGPQNAPDAGAAPAGLPPVGDPVARLERQALEVIVQMPVVAARVGADDISPVAFAVPVHRAVFEAIEAAGGAAEVPSLIARAEDSGLARADAVNRATVHWIEQVRAGAIGPVSAAITELAVAPLPLTPPRERGAEPEPHVVERYARGVLSALARTGINRELAELRARHRRMTADDADYRDVFEQIVGLENRRMQIARES